MKTKKLKLILALALLSSAKNITAQTDPGTGEWAPGMEGNAAGTPCIPTASPWHIGGDYITTAPGWNPGSLDAQNQAGSGYVFDAGTCNNFPFVLKANNFKSVFIQPSGNIGFNVQNPGAVVDIMNPVGGNQSNFRIYADQKGNLESTTDINMNFAAGKTFNINEGPVGSSTNRVTLLSGGNVGIGTTIVNAKLVVNDRTSNANGIGIWAGASSAYAFSIFDGAGASKYLIYPDGKTRLFDNMQIGFITTMGMVDPNARLNIEANGPSLNGLKLTTNYSGKMIEINNSNASPNTLPSTFIVYGDGKTQIGNHYPATAGVAANAMLSVDGMILARDIRVSNSQNTHWADFVFEKDYKLMSLSEIENYVAKNKHLPNVPSEAEVKAEGVDLMEMNVQLLQKVEELYLHTINLQKQNEKLEKQLEKLSSDIKAVSK